MESDVTQIAPNPSSAPGTQTPGGLGLRSLFAVSIGVIVAQQAMVSLLQGIGIGGWGFVAALLVAFMIALANAMAYAEMALMIPSAGSLSSYAEVALGNFPAILLVFAGYVTPALFGLPAELILANEVLRKTIPLAVPPYFWPFVIVVVFSLLNIIGTDVMARIQTVLSFSVLAFLIVTGLVATSGLAAQPLPGGRPEAFSALGSHTTTFGVIALAFWVFVGSEFVAPLVREAKNASRDLPRAMIGGLFGVLFAQLLFGIGSAFLIPRDLLLKSATPHLDYAVAAFGPAARVWAALLAVTASASLVNTALASLPRMLQGMAENGQVMPFLKYTHPRFGTPVMAILFVSALPLIGLVWSGGEVGSILPLLIAASVSWLLAYMTAQISLIVLRWRQPQLPRPFKVPGYPFVPVLALAGMAFVIATSSPSPELTPVIIGYTGIVLGVFATMAAVWVKFVMKRGLFEAGPAPR
jgi:amino acid transporter